MGETLQTLGIYWPKLIAQTINFAIVLFVLWKWAYQPVLKILEERQRRTAEAMKNADKIKSDLAQAEATREQILADANAKANKFIEEARAAAAKVQEQETQKAIAMAEQIIVKAREAAAADHTRMLAELKREVVRLVVQTTVTVTGKVLTAEDQKRLADEAAKQLTK
jgi:F-type H+-transporting ATPase subunit b